MPHIEYQVHVEAADDPESNAWYVYTLEGLRQVHPAIAALVADAGDAWRLVWTQELWRYTVEPIEAYDEDEAQPRENEPLCFTAHLSQQSELGATQPGHTHDAPETHSRGENEAPVMPCDALLTRCRICGLPLTDVDRCDEEPLHRSCLDRLPEIVQTDEPVKHSARSNPVKQQFVDDLVAGQRWAL